MGLRKNEFLTKKKYWASVLVVLVVALGLFSVFSYQSLSTPRYVTKGESLELYSLKGWYEWSAIVEKENPIWPTGTVLQNRTVYFREVAPQLSGKFSFQISSTKPMEITADYQLKKILSSSGKDIIYWSKEEIIDSGRGSNFQIDFQLNMTAIEKEVKKIKESLNFYGGNIELKLRASVNYQGEIGNEKVDGQKEFFLVIRPSDYYYEVSANPVEKTVKKEIVRTVVVHHSNSEKARLISIPVALFLGVVALTAMKLQYKPLTESEIENLLKEKEHHKYREQIKIGEFPLWLANVKKPIKVESLKDLVKIAIDMDKTVICDPKKDYYFVIADDIAYFFSYE